MAESRQMPSIRASGRARSSCSDVASDAVRNHFQPTFIRGIEEAADFIDAAERGVALVSPPARSRPRLDDEHAAASGARVQRDGPSETAPVASR